MELTGKCKEAFEEWRIKTGSIYDFQESNEISGTTEDGFDVLPNSAKWGVYQDFFNSVGIHFSIFRCVDFSEYAYELMKEDEKFGYFYEDSKESFDSIEETRSEVIKKANEIYNGNNSSK